MTSPAKMNEYNHAEEPARVLLERLRWRYVSRETLAADRGDALLTGQYGWVKHALRNFGRLKSHGVLPRPRYTKVRSIPR